MEALSNIQPAEYPEMEYCHDHKSLLSECDCSLPPEIAKTEYNPEMPDLVSNVGPELEDVLYEDRVNVNDFYI